MARLNAANNARTTLSSSITASATSFSVANGSILPATPFMITIDNEIMEVGGKSGNALTSVLRGREGTTAVTHASGAVVENRLTAGSYNELATADSVGTAMQMIDAHESSVATGAHLIKNISGLEEALSNSTFSFDNLAELKGCTKSTTFNADGSISEHIVETAGGANVATRETVFNPDDSITVTTTVYDDDGTTILKQATVTTTFDGDVISEVIT